MRPSRRGLTYLGLVVAIIAVAVIVYRNPLSAQAQQASSGQFFAAISNYGHNSSDKTNTISSNPSQQATINGDGTDVTWYAEDGTRYDTTVASSDSVTKAFNDAHFFNYKNDSSSGSGLLLSILPTLLILGGAVLLFWFMMR